MAEINIGIFDEHALLGEALAGLMEGNNDLYVHFCCCKKDELIDCIKSQRVNILLLTLHEVLNGLSLISNIHHSFPKTKLLIISPKNDESTILNIIKSGANGFLSKDAGKTELIEAIYTLRNGHDYFSKSVTQLLLKNYVSNIKQGNQSTEKNLNQLSQRETEILKLWSESFSNQEIADKLFISIRTVESHKNHIMQKLNLKTTVDMVKFAIRNNLIKI